MKIIIEDRLDRLAGKTLPKITSSRDASPRQFCCVIGVAPTPTIEDFGSFTSRAQQIHRQYIGRINIAAATGFRKRYIAQNVGNVISYARARAKRNPDSIILTHTHVREKKELDTLLCWRFITRVRTIRENSINYPPRPDRSINARPALT